MEVKDEDSERSMNQYSIDDLNQSNSQFDLPKISREPESSINTNTTTNLQTGIPQLCEEDDIDSGSSIHSSDLSLSEED